MTVVAVAGEISPLLTCLTNSGTLPFTLELFTNLLIEVLKGYNLFGLYT